MSRAAHQEMTLVQLTYFTAAATHGSMTAAAGSLHVAQSAVSAAISQLERSLGVQLFVRQRSKGIVLTAAGEQLLRDARSVLAHVDEMADSARGRHHDVRGTLRFACFVTLAPFVLPRLITHLKVKHPGLRIEVIEADLDGTVAMLRSGAVEAAIAYDLGLGSDLVSEVLYGVAPHVVLPLGHPLADRAGLKLADLAGEDMVLLDIPHSRQYFLELLAAAGVEPTIRYSSRSYETVRALVAEGHGFSILSQIPRVGATYDGRQIVAVPILDEVKALDVCFVHLAGVRPTARARVVAAAASAVFGTASA